MKKNSLFLLALFVLVQVQSQTTPTPDKLWGNLFEEVQLKRIFADNKTFVDMVPQHAPAVILKNYNQLKQKDTADLRSFVLANFYMPVTPDVHVKEGLLLKEHLNELWNTLPFFLCK